MVDFKAYLPNYPVNVTYVWYVGIFKTPERHLKLELSKRDQGSSLNKPNF